MGFTMQLAVSLSLCEYTTFLTKVQQIALSLVQSLIVGKLTNDSLFEYLADLRIKFFA